MTPANKSKSPAEIAAQECNDQLDELGNYYAFMDGVRWTIAQCEAMAQGSITEPIGDRNYTINFEDFWGPMVPLSKIMALLEGEK